MLVGRRIKNGGNKMKGRAIFHSKRLMDGIDHQRTVLMYNCNHGQEQHRYLFFKNLEFRCGEKMACSSALDKP